MDEAVWKELFVKGEHMTIHEMYIEDEYFKNEVDRFANKHRTTLKAAIKSLEIQKVYKTHLQFLSKSDRGRLR